MSAYGWAWLVVVTMVPLALLALHLATRGWRIPRTRIVIALLVAVWLMLPAPVPGYPGAYAPAFLVFAFEWLFQRPGDPQTAGVILAAGTAVALAAGLIVAVRWGRRRPAGEDT